MHTCSGNKKDEIIFKLKANSNCFDYMSYTMNSRATYIGTRWSPSRNMIYSNSISRAEGNDQLCLECDIDTVNFVRACFHTEEAFIS